MFVKTIVIAILIFLVSPMLLVFADQQTTTMTWFIPSSKSHSIAYGGACSSTAFFFPEDEAIVDNDVDGNGYQILPFDARSSGTACQSDSAAGMTITNTGNVTTNIDANFASALDTNVWLKVWQGTGAGCGTSGIGGWQRLCTYHAPNDATSTVTQSACRDFNSSNATVGARLVTSLPIADTNQLCFTGDLLPAIFGFDTAVAAGDHNGTFQTSTDFS